MSTEDRDQSEGMDAQTDEALWTLLGRRETPRQVSPYFARRVLREVGLSEEARTTGWRAWLQRWVQPALTGRRTALWSGALSGVCALGLVFLVHSAPLQPRVAKVRQGKADSAATLVAPEAANNAQKMAGDDAAANDDSVPVEENEVIADLDNILQREESRLWTDDTSTIARF